jgi:GDP-4-dehydro-6-deoxy-D-mannose reductase
VRVLVSGANGFVGVHLTRELVEHGHEVVAVSKGSVVPEIADLVVDYADQDLVEAWPAEPTDAVVHLAGLAAVGPSFSDPQGYLTGNSAPVTNLCEQLLAAGRSPRVVVVSTGAVYAPGVRLHEASPTQASSPYVVSKLLVELQCSYYRRRGLDVTVMRPFNHIGPGQQPGFLLPDLIAGMEAGALTAGNLDTRRDYTDVRDVARAYRLAVEAERIDAPVLNVCSGVSVAGRTVLGLVARELGIANPEVTLDQTRLRPDDPAEISGDNSLIFETLDWHPVIPLERTVRDAIATRAGR